MKLKILGIKQAICLLLMDTSLQKSSKLNQQKADQETEKCNDAEIQMHSRCPMQPLKEKKRQTMAGLYERRAGDVEEMRFQIVENMLSGL